MDDHDPRSFHLKSASTAYIEFDFSNKKWDKITKELRGKDLIIIYKIDENLFIKPS